MQLVGNYCLPVDARLGRRTPGRPQEACRRRTSARAAEARAGASQLQANPRGRPAGEQKRRDGGQLPKRRQLGVSPTLTLHPRMRQLTVPKRRRPVRIVVSRRRFREAHHRERGRLAVPLVYGPLMLAKHNDRGHELAPESGLDSFALRRRCSRLWRVTSITPAIIAGLIARRRIRRRDRASLLGRQVGSAFLAEP